MQLTKTIKHSRYVRSILLLCVILAGIATFLIISGKKIQEKHLQVQEEILVGQKQLSKLQMISKGGNEPKDLSAYHFAEFDEVIPFISELENLFNPVAGEVQISLQGDEVEIQQKHEADYVVLLSDIKNEADFKKVLGELYENSKILELSNLVIEYHQEQGVESAERFQFNFEEIFLYANLISDEVMNNLEPEHAKETKKEIQEAKEDDSRSQDSLISPEPKSETDDSIEEAVGKRREDVEQALEDQKEKKAKDLRVEFERGGKIKEVQFLVKLALL